jgi:hypothetical protein
VSGQSDEDGPLLEAQSESPDAFHDPDALDQLRSNAFESVGLPYAEGVLYGIGLAEGLYDALRVARRFAGPLGGTPSHAGASVGMLFTPGAMSPDHRFTGSLFGSTEATVHLRRYGASPEQVCHVSAGYCAGWYSAMFNEFILVRERSCAATGHSCCEFDARPARTWIEADNRWAISLLAYLNFEVMREAALKRIAADGDESEGDMMGGFDPLSPAVHVWGPVMVLPYSGAGDTLGALETIATDLGPRAIRVVVLDVTGARIDAVEATGLLRTLDELARRELETVLVGVSKEVSQKFLGLAEGLSHPLRAADISEGIRLAFQLAAFA